MYCIKKGTKVSYMEKKNEQKLHDFIGQTLVKLKIENVVNIC